MRRIRSRMNSSGGRISLMASSVFTLDPRSIRPRLLVPSAIERRHSATNREELALRVHLARDAVIQLVEECALEILSEQHAGVAQREGRPLRQLARQLPRAVEQPVLGKHFTDRSPFKRFSGAQLLPGEEKIPCTIASDDRRPDDV